MAEDCKKNKNEFTIDSVPYAPLTIVPESVAPEVWLLLDPDTPNWVVVDDIGKEIIGLIGEAKSVGEITTILCEKYGGPFDESARNILAFVNDLKRRYFLRDDAFPAVERTDMRIGLFEEFWLHVTNQCNLRCKTCYIGSGLPFENELTAQEIKNIIDEAKNLGARRMVISGGEPFLRKDILDILRYACNNLHKVTFITNGSLITEERASNLGDYSNVMVQVSLDGAREETHDFIRGKGSYKKTVKGIGHLVKEHVPCAIAMTLVKQNVNEISEMVDLAKRVGVNRLHFPILQLIGRARTYESEVVPDDDNVVSAIKEILEIPRNEDIRVSIEKKYRKLMRLEQKRNLCGAGSFLISIAADGRVYPCCQFHQDEFCAGTIREHSLKELLETNEVFNQFRAMCVLDIPECRTCEFKFICGGGCHVDRYRVHGHLRGLSPRCKQYKEIYWHLFLEEAKSVMGRE